MICIAYKVKARNWEKSQFKDESTIRDRTKKTILYGILAVQEKVARPYISFCTSGPHRFVELLYFVVPGTV